MAITKDKQDTIKALFRAGLTQDEIVKRVGANKRTVNAYVKKFRKKDEIREKEIALAYNEIKPYKKTVEDLKNNMLGFMNFVLENCQDEQEFARMDPIDKNAFAVKIAEIIMRNT